jgi:hypothetical protein
MRTAIVSPLIQRALRMSAFIATLWIAMGMLVAPVHARTTVSGDILTQTWTKANSPYIVTATVSVPYPEILTIEPGVDVLFDSPDAEFVAYGLVHAIGTQLDSIRFLPNTANGVQSWGGVRLYGYPCGIDHCLKISDETMRFEYIRVSHVVNTWGGFVVKYGVVGPGLSMRDCIISQNHGTENIGGMYLGGDVYPTDVTIVRCTIAYNTTPGIGGGIYIAADVDQFDSCVVAFNSAGEGGGVSFFFLRNTNNTIYQNTPDNLNLEAGHGIRNLILWGDSSIQVTGDPLGATYSNIQGGHPGEGNIDEDPMFVDPENLDFRLRKDSPCIDAGDPDLTDADGTRSDMGAFYYHQETNDVASAERPGRVTQISAVYPNPFNPEATIRYELAHDGPVTLTLYSVLGRRVRRLVAGTGSPGERTVVWDGRDEAGRHCGSGVYTVLLEHGNLRMSRRLTLLR